jgi:hypothetical protein
VSDLVITELKKREQKYQKQYRIAHQKERQRYQRQWRDRNREKILEYQKRERAKNPEKHRERRRQWYIRNRDTRREWLKENRKNRKLEVITHYGGKCQWPNGCDVRDPDMLTIDHINGNGANHRREFKKIGQPRIDAWLIKNNYPAGFRVLCFNHNIKHYLNMRRMKED